MINMGKGCIALPGGLGTLEESMTVSVMNQFSTYMQGTAHKPFGLLNTDGFYDHLMKQLQHCVKEGFLRKEHLNLIHCEEDPQLLVQKILSQIEQPKKIYQTSFASWENEAIKKIQTPETKIVMEPPTMIENVDAMQQPPTMDEWMSMKSEDIKEMVKQKQLTVEVAIDGTRRYYQIY